MTSEDRNMLDGTFVKPMDKCCTSTFTACKATSSPHFGNSDPPSYSTPSVDDKPNDDSPDSLPLVAGIDLTMMGMFHENYTRVSEFFIVGFPSLQSEYFQIVAWFFFFLYVTTVVGNLLLVLVFALQQSLQKPLYIVMVSLALSDIGFTTVALPKLIARYWWNDGSLGFYTCHFQKHMIHYFGSLNSLILLTMAFDRYLAICFPLRYSVLMTNQTMTGLTIFCWVIAHIFPVISTISFTMMAFCGPNQIVHAFCDTISLTPLVCGNASPQFSIAYSVAMFILYVPFTLIIISYMCIIISILRMSSGQGRTKTFSTCATQGCIISIYYIPRFFIYSTPYFPSLIITPDSRIATSLFYSLLPPLINPFIYCLRTNEIKKIFGRWVQKHKPITPTEHGQIAAVMIS
ncbi:olfactory receptor 1E16-like [Channa argus]|uniref:olfactory receptor 1E16-like n=1 Tax=Channa argus TaxID=215402 RepID=UPI00351FFD40